MKPFDMNMVLNVTKPDYAKYLHLRGFGYAPGDYMARCVNCNETNYNCDKRAVTCLACASKMYEEQQNRYANFNLLAIIDATCKIVGNTKDDQPNIMLSMLEEAGETATEVKISHGLKNKPQGVDGIVGEAIDTILCAMDLIHSEIGSLDNHQVKSVFELKLNKWKLKYSKPA